MNEDNNKLFLDMFIQESNQLLEEIANAILHSEKEGNIFGHIDEIFRAMHTIKGSSAMMGFDGVSSLTHSLENLMDEIRKNRESPNVELREITDLVLGTVDFVREEIGKIERDADADGDANELLCDCERVLEKVQSRCLMEETSQISRNLFEGDQSTEAGKAYYYTFWFKYLVDTELPNIRTYAAIQSIKGYCIEGGFAPCNIEDPRSAEKIMQDGVYTAFSSLDGHDAISERILKILFMDGYELKAVEEPEYDKAIGCIREDRGWNNKEKTELKNNEAETKTSVVNLSRKVVSVDVKKLDMLLDIVGELVISGVMVTNSKDLKNLKLDNFEKASRQHVKIINELQDIVMSIRMVPIDIVFTKMNRIVRDLSKNMKKDIIFKVSGENTEVDKNIIEQLSDPLMHLIRNSVDHGIESIEERISLNKPEQGQVHLEAKNAGGDVWIIVRDDGKGLDKDKILNKAKEKNLLTKPEEEYSEKEIYQFILLPGFSTKDSVSEVSGRGVGMDVAKTNIEKIGGSILIDSIKGKGTTITIKIPLTLAIIDGMLVSVGEGRYIIPTGSIRESFKVTEKQIVCDTDGTEMIMIRGSCHAMIRVHERFGVVPKVFELEEGIIIAVENEKETICLFVDELIGEQQVVVKPIPGYIKKSGGIAGCTIQGDGTISLIIDIKGLTEK